MSLFNKTHWFISVLSLNVTNILWYFLVLEAARWVSSVQACYFNFSWERNQLCKWIIVSHICLSLRSFISDRRSFIVNNVCTGFLKYHYCSFIIAHHVLNHPIKPTLSLVVILTYDPGLYDHCAPLTSLSPIVYPYFSKISLSLLYSHLFVSSCDLSSFQPQR